MNHHVPDEGGEQLFYIIDDDAAEHIMSLLWSLHDTISMMLLNRQIVVPSSSVLKRESEDLTTLLSAAPKGGIEDIF